MILSCINGFKLKKENDNCYSVISPNGETMVNTIGTRKEVKKELERWKKKIDFDNKFMIEVDNNFINILSDL